MEKWQEEDCKRVAALFEDVRNRAAFARDYSVPGGQAMIYQHINVLRPVGLDAAVAYARGFHVSLSTISPTLATKVQEVLKVGVAAPSTTSETKNDWPFRDVTADQWKTLDLADKGRVEGYAMSLIATHQTDKSRKEIA